MVAFLRRFSLHYGIYRRYPLRPFKALKTLGGSHATDGVPGEMSSHGVDALPAIRKSVRRVSVDRFHPP
jgi:hypothetical protein